MQNKSGTFVNVDPLRHGALSSLDGFATSIAAIAPAVTILTLFGAIFASSGLGSPFVILFATVAFALHINTIAEYNKISPSPGFYVSYIGRSFGVIVGTMTAVMYGVGELILLGAAIFGPALWDQEVFRLITGTTPSWIYFIVIQGTIGVLVVLSGVVVSVRVTTFLFLLEVISILIAVTSIFVFNHSYIIGSLVSFSPLSVSGGFKGFSGGFVLCVLMFSGCSAAAPMSDEMKNPRRNIPIAVFSSVFIAGFLYVVAAWAQVVGFHNSISAMSGLDFPFIAATSKSTNWLTYVIYFSGITSGLAVTVATTNAASRLYYNMSRERLLPKSLGYVLKMRKTPFVSITAAVVGSLFVTIFYTLYVGGFSYKGGYLGYGQISTLGTDLVIGIYILANIGLPFFYIKFERSKLSIIKHLIIPALGSLLLVYPFWETITPFQSPPLDYWWIVVVFILIAGLTAGIFAKRYNLPVGKYMSQEDTSN